MYKSLVLFTTFLLSAAAFTPGSFSSKSAQKSLLLSTESDSADVVMPRNPDRPELPLIKGDYNWDEKFANDPEWITENVPGKIVLSDIEIASQATALSKLEDKYRAIREQKEYDDARILGWTSRAEMFNGRFAMFFLVVGLLTEYWTGVTIPGQIEEMLRVGGFIGPDY
mmetsp:Transcript_18514/g.26065  ORF Transcript_18514/g.26065 Transcript_18514/m.26065 type:complete len:169 (+) Transcript_18514:111-617(+)|eukprot:CAMPEP_0184856764 /NCGR_PEP_ID=MMETSP0580-20130426/1949_1 /TAXON_ID=1118495 /ORGANISM="Dactyliosolen fragilissimus" /LENGTH=168 /DNA_ID=CAMNT_0027351977 /DNA_START=98 /DNA_END=604 /DNA_ORIENTATION=-